MWERGEKGKKKSYKHESAAVGKGGKQNFFISFSKKKRRKGGIPKNRGMSSRAVGGGGGVFFFSGAGRKKRGKGTAGAPPFYFGKGGISLALKGERPEMGTSFPNNKRAAAGSRGGGGKKNHEANFEWQGGKMYTSFLMGLKKTEFRGGGVFNNATWRFR